MNRRNKKLDYMWESKVLWVRVSKTINNRTSLVKRLDIGIVI